MTGTGSLTVQQPKGRRRARSSLSCFVFNVVVVGSSQSGKTAIIHQFVNNVFREKHIPTVSDTYEKVFTRENDNAQYLLKILDLGGCARNEFHATYSSMMAQGNVFCLVYSIDDRKSFLDVEKFWNDISKEDNRPTMIIGNKKDKEKERQVSRSEGESIASRLGCGFMEVTATDEKDVENAFVNLLSQIELFQIRDPNKRKASAQISPAVGNHSLKKDKCVVM